jgi:DNA sulfur modification protein DndD
MAKQVKSGIEGILGVQVLRGRQRHPRDYASIRPSGVERIEDPTLSRVQVQITEIEARLVPLVREPKP